MTPDTRDLSFVISRTDNFQESHKSEIYSHIARATQKRRRQKVRQIASSRGSSSTSSTASQDLSSWTFKRDTPQRSALQCVDHGTHPVSGCGQCLLASEELRSGMSTSLFPYHGNSDPFNSQAIDIDARAIYYLEVGSYSIDNILTGTGLWVHSPPRGALAVKRAAYSDLNTPLGQRLFGQIPADMSDAVQTQWMYTFAYAMLANYAGNLFTATDSPEHRDNARIYIGKCIAGLRGYISSGYTHDHFRPESLIFRLLRAEMAQKSFSNALVHAIYLKKVVENQEGYGKIDIPFILHGLYNSNQLAFTLWTRPLFEATWLESVFGSHWEPWTDDRFDVAAFKNCLSAFTKLDDLAELMASTKILFMQTSQSLSQNLSAVDDNWYWLQSRSEWLQINLFNIVRNEEERAAFVLSHRIVEQAILDQDEVISAVQAHTAAVIMNMYLAIATILSIRFHTQDPMLNGQSITPVLRIILIKLSTSFRSLEPQIVTTYLLGRYKDALLWVAFVAAIVEHRNRDFLLKHDSYGLWYRTLTDIIASERVQSWKELRLRLQQFPFSEEETPLPDPNWLDSAFTLGGRASSHDSSLTSLVSALNDSRASSGTPEQSLRPTAFVIQRSRSKHVN